MIINDDPYVVYYVWYVLENRTRDLEAIYLRDPVVRFAGLHCIFKQKRLVISGSSSQPSRKILTTKTLTSEPEVSPGLEKLLDLWVKDW